MNTWVRVIHSTVGALAAAKADLEALAEAENQLTKAKTLEELHYQRGKVDGIKAVLFLLTSNK